MPLQLHLLLVHHATCEHGELVDAPLHDGAASGPKPRAGAAGPEARDSQASASTAGHGDGSDQLSRAQDDHPGGHHHCDALAVRHFLPEVGPAIAAASLSWVEPASVDGERAERRSVPILSLAPKGSPPVA